MEGFFWDSFTAQREIVYSKLHFICHTWKVYPSPWNFELRVNLFDSPSLISSTYHWFIDVKRHWKILRRDFDDALFCRAQCSQNNFFSSQIGNFPCIVFSRTDCRKQFFFEWLTKSGNMNMNADRIWRHKVMLPLDQNCEKLELWNI